MHLERIKTRYLPKLYARTPEGNAEGIRGKAIFFVAEAHIRAALLRKESRRYVFRSDYPEQDNKNWLKHSLLRNVNGEMTFSKKDVRRLGSSS